MAAGPLEGPGREGAPPARRAGSPAAPDVVLCDDGDLEDVYQALLRLGEPPLRVRPAALPQLEAWEKPRRLFVTGVRAALAPPGPAQLVGKHVVSIAVADRATNTLCATLLRRGFRYVVRRPVHPEALRLLLRQVLFLGPEQRQVMRVAFGGLVRWRKGLRRGRCTMSEISATGCRILTNERFAVGDRLHLRVPSALRDGRAIRLKGRVVRRDLGDPAVRPRRAQVAVAFWGLSARAQADLDALLAERATGPVPLPAGSAACATPPTSAPTLPPAAPAAPEARGASAEAEPATCAPPSPSRRVRARVEWRDEVVALDPVAEQAVDTLFGRDLSSHGMRVEPHPNLRPGDRLRIALYDPTSAEPLVLTARVTRDDGGLGLALAFEDVDPTRRAQLDRMVTVLPPVATLASDEKGLDAIVLGGVLVSRSGAPVVV